MAGQLQFAMSKSELQSHGVFELFADSRAGSCRCAGLCVTGILNSEEQPPVVLLQSNKESPAACRC